MTEQHKNGCFDRPPFAEFHVIQPGQQIPNFSFGEPCRYKDSDLGRADKGCEGCKHRGAAV